MNVDLEICGKKRNEQGRDEIKQMNGICAKYGIGIYRSLIPTLSI